MQSFALHWNEGYISIFLGTKGVVGWSYHAEEDFILDLEEGDVVLIFDKRKDGWWRGMIGEREGLFQAGCLQGCRFNCVLTITPWPHSILCCYTAS